MRTPAEVYQPSQHSMPVRLPEHEYDDDVEVRRVRLDGSMKWGGNFVFIGEAFAGELVGARQITEEHWHLYLGPMKLGVVHERSRTVMPMTAEGN